MQTKINNSIRLRKKTNTAIQYILIANGSPLVSPILIPDAFNNHVLQFLRLLPSDIHQVADSVNYLEIYLRENMCFGYDFQVFNIEHHDLLKEHINSSKQIQFFFLDGSKIEHSALYHELNDNKSYIRFFFFYNGKPSTINGENVIISHIQFIENIINRQKEIISYLSNSNSPIAPSVSLVYKGFNLFNPFIPTRTNYFAINRIIGNFDYNSQHSEETYDIKGHAEESSKANLKANSFDRQDMVVEQIGKIDHFFHSAYYGKVLVRASGIESVLPPLIIVLPFHNRDLKEIYKDLDLMSLLQTEQSQNYIHIVDKNIKNIDAPFSQYTFVAKVQKQRINYLDDVAFLHSSLTFSPVIRLPIKGKSLNYRLSNFRPTASMNISEKNLKKTIYRFGKELKESVVSPKLEKVIKERDGQIVAITDLPIEWTLIGDIPLSFTHDVCRLPETSLHGLMAFYTCNQTFEYSVPKDILKKTLVILGAHEDGFRKWHKEVRTLSEESGFLIAECFTLEDVKTAIHKHKPDLLIFDCHGGYDKETRSTYLCIGDEILNGEYVVKNNLYAPIMFLSACGTAPTYGTTNPIANAFFEAGALSVTSTYLPINIDRGSTLYLRVLKKLDYASKHVIHKNWLEFICHTIRTSSIHDAYLSATKKHDFTKEIFNSNALDIGDSLMFSKRRKQYYDMDNKLSKLVNNQYKYYSNTIPEYLFYSNLGRGDLIYFDSWEEEYTKKNGVEQFI